MKESSPIKVFVAEDVPITRIALLLILSRMPDIEVVGTAVDGQDAYKQCLSIKPDVVIMDLSMPIMDGIEATKLIRQELASTRVVMMTTHERDDDVFGALAAGADGYCLKSTSAEHLLIAIKTVADGAAWLDPRIAERVLRSSFRPNYAPTEEVSENEDSLTKRELEVLKLLVDGLTNQEMAARLFVSLETIKTHMRHIMEKLAVSDRTQAAVKAVRKGMA